MVNSVSERVLARDEIPWDSLKLIGRDSLREMQRTRFYLQRKEVPSGENLAVFVSNLPFNLSQRQYEKILLDILGKGITIDSPSLSYILLYFRTGTILRLNGKYCGIVKSLNFT